MWRNIKNIYHLGVAVLANIFYKFPSRKLRVVGVTGTDGKTTTTSLIYHILNTAGFKSSMVTSVGAVISGKKYDIGFHVTTPSPFAIQKFFKKALDTGSEFLVLETTSHALDQYRVWGINFEVGVLTNVTHEHLDYHKTYENYVKTKVKLLKMSKIVIVNKDDESFALLDPKLKIKNEKLITYGMGKNSDINPENFKFKTNMVGKFNVYNSLAAIAACKAFGISNEDIRRGLKSFKPPIGREEIVYKKDFTVMIDFAHTPNAFDQILSAIRPKVKRKLIHVFGSAGLRDRTKRPKMGEISSQYADIIILTSEDPRSEAIGKINTEIKSGIPHFAKASAGKQNSVQVLEIADRKEAIKAAIKMAKKGDFVITTGKSHEKSMNYGHGEKPWDEYKAVLAAVKNEK